MHCQTDGREHAVRVMNNVNQFAKIGAFAQVDHVCEGGVIIVTRAELDELNAIPEVVDDVLKAHRIPPLRSEIVFAAADYDPVLLALFE